MNKTKESIATEDNRAIEGALLEFVELHQRL